MSSEFIFERGNDIILMQNKFLMIFILIQLTIKLTYYNKNATFAMSVTNVGYNKIKELSYTYDDAVVFM